MLRLRCASIASTFDARTAHIHSIDTATAAAVIFGGCGKQFDSHILFVQVVGS